MSNIIFISSERAGLLEGLVRDLGNITSKRKRQAEFRSLLRVIKGLKLVPQGAEVWMLAQGTNSLGEYGVVVTLVPAGRQIIPPEQALTELVHGRPA